VVSDRTAGGGAVAGEDVDDASGEASLDAKLSSAEGTERSLLGRLHDHDVAAGKERADLPGPHEEREVPRDDDTADADGLEEGHDEAIAIDGDGLAAELVSPASVVAERLEDEVEVNASVINGLAVVSRLNLSELLAVLLDEVSKAVEETATVAGVHVTPGLESTTGSLDSEVHISLVGFLDLGDDVAGGRVDGVEGLAGGRVDPLVVDEELGGT